MHDVDAQLSPGALHVLHPGSCGGDGAAGSVRSPSCARCARPAFAICSTRRTPRVFLHITGVQGAKLGPVAGCMDEPLTSPRWAYAFVWLLRPTSRRGAGVEASGGEVVGCRFWSKSHGAMHGARQAEKNTDTPVGTIRAYLNIFQRFLQR